MADISFGQNVWWIVPALVVAGALTYWTYRQTVPRLNGTFRWLVPLIRFCSLSLILFLLLEPLLTRQHTLTTEPVLAILVDESESLGVTAGPDSSNSSNIARMRRMLTTIPLGSIGGNVRLFGFGSDARAINPASGWTDSLLFDQQRTNMSLALQRVRDELSSDNLRAVMVVSDGRHNSGRNPVFVAERYPVPILASVVGDTTERRDLYVRSVVANEIGYVDSELPVRAVIRSDGVEERRVSVSLIVDGAVVQTEPLQIRPGVEHTTNLTFVPETAGLKRVSVAVTRVENEVTYRNNTESIAIQVLDTKKRVLLLASSPGPDVSAIRQMLERDANIELSVSIHRGGSTYYESPLPDSTGFFDLVVLAGYPGKQTPADQVQSVVSDLGSNTGVLFLLGRDTDLSKVARFMPDVLPVFATSIRGEFLESSLTVAEVGRAHPILESVDLSPTDWDRLPPLEFNTSVWRVAPDARVLATARVRNVALPDPVIAVRQRTTSRSAAVMASGTWRWKNLPEDLDAYDQVWETMFSNVVAWLTADNDDRLVRVRPVATSFAASDRIAFSGQVYDESLQPVSDAAVEISVLAPDGNRFPFVMDAAGNGRYTLDTEALPGGSYRYRATAMRNGAEIGSDEGSFVVGDLAIEFKETRSDPVLMRQLAQRSGGQTVSETTFADLSGILARLGGFEPRIETATRETELWRRYVFLAGIVLLLTLEWFLRKRNGLV